MSSSKTVRNVPPPVGGSAKASVYSRFIPREELSSFSAWNPEVFAGAEPAVPPVQRQEPPPPEEPMPDPAEVMAEQITAARQGGYEDGYRDGLVALEGFKQSFAQQMTSRLAGISHAYAQQLDDLQQDMARALAVTASHLAAQIVRHELSTRPELIAHAAQEALDTLLLSARHVTVRVHPDDHSLVAQGTGEALQARGARLLPDPEVTRGGCLVDSDIGVVDASLETRWKRAVAAIGVEQPWDVALAQSRGESEA